MGDRGEDGGEVVRRTATDAHLLVGGIERRVRAQREEVLDLGLSA